MDKITVIVAVYNTEDYLEKCIDSIINQSYKNLEIILVNDGSTDSSLKICERFEKEDSRIIVINKLNGGLSDARNFGMDIASGCYLTFIDSDDFIGEFHIENLYYSIKKCKTEISVSKLHSFNDHSLTFQNSINRKSVAFTQKKALEELLKQQKFDTSACGKMFRTDLFKNISFPKDYLYEDLATIYKVFLKADTISLVNSKDYYYFQRPNSIMNSKFNTKKLIIQKILEAMIQDISYEYDELETYCHARSFSAYINIWKNIDIDENKAEYLYLWNKILIESKKINLLSSIRIKVKLAKILVIFGPKVFKKMVQ